MRSVAVTAAFGAIACFAMPGAAQQANATPRPLHGRVVDLRGDGVARARLWLTSTTDPAQHLPGTITDDNGYFRIEHVPHGTWDLVRATADGRCDGQWWFRDTERPARILMHDAAAVRGVLRKANGAAVAGVEVRAVHVSRAFQPPDCLATTDDQGRFSLTSVPLGPAVFVAFVPGEGLHTLRTLVGGNREVTLECDDRATTTMQIVVNGLPPSPKAVVSIRPGIDGRGRLLAPGTHTLVMPQPWHRVALGAEGTAALTHVPDEDYSITVRVLGFLTTPAVATAKAGEGPHRVMFVVKPSEESAPRIRAVLRDRAGAPLAGVHLAMRFQGTSQEATSGDDGQLVFASPAAEGAPVRIESRDDRWVLDQTKGAGMDSVNSPEWLDEHECVVDSSTPLDLRACAACGVFGRVVLPDGGPAAFGAVELRMEQSERSPRWQRVAMGTTARDGTFQLRRVHPLPGRAQIVVTNGPGLATSEPFVLTTPGSSRTLAPIELAPTTGLEGNATDADGRPASGVLVRWTTTQDGRMNLHETITDRLGRYRLGDVDAGKGELSLLVEDLVAVTKVTLELTSGALFTQDLQMPRK